VSDIRKNMILAAARAMAVSEVASSRVRWSFSNRMSEEEWREAKRLSLEWIGRSIRERETVVRDAVEAAAELVELGGQDG
jgi:hypothetical protein